MSGSDENKYNENSENSTWHKHRQQAQNNNMRSLGVYKLYEDADVTVQRRPKDVRLAWPLVVE